MRSSGSESVCSVVMNGAERAEVVKQLQALGVQVGSAAGNLLWVLSGSIPASVNEGICAAEVPVSERIGQLAGTLAGIVRQVEQLSKASDIMYSSMQEKAAADTVERQHEAIGQILSRLEAQERRGLVEGTEVSLQVDFRRMDETTAGLASSLAVEINRRDWQGAIAVATSLVKRLVLVSLPVARSAQPIG